MSSHPPTRQAVYGRAAVASSQPLATSAGLQTLLAGGNAVDAAVAVAAALAVTEPCSNGAGGDCFALLFNNADASVTAVHGNGAAPAALTPEAMGDPPVSVLSPHTVPVPGAVAAWVDMVERFGSGKVSLSQVLAPAIRLAEDGFPVGPLTATDWKASEELLLASSGGESLLIRAADTNQFRAPRKGEIFRNTDLATTLRKVANEGFDGYYRGSVAKAIVDCLQGLGGTMRTDDLEAHRTEVQKPISTTYRGYTVYETGPPTHGAVALEALNVLEGFDASLDEPTAAHVMVEALRQAFAEASRGIADPACSPDVTKSMICKEHAAMLRKKIRMDGRSEVSWGDEMSSGGTVQFCVVDGFGNGVSMIQSNYQGFGTGHVPHGTGFSLHNRGLNFAPRRDHPNCVAGGKKPYHTIIPAMMTKEDGQLFACLGVMGSFMQPQGHLQVVRRLVDCGYDAQQALDAPRLRVTGPFSKVERGLGEEGVLVEPGVAEDIVQGLRKRGHNVKVEYAGFFGRGQVCVLRRGVVEAGSDNRADGCAAVL